MRRVGFDIEAHQWRQPDLLRPLRPIASHSRVFSSIMVKVINSDLH
jgi:hypothetical protein